MLPRRNILRATPNIDNQTLSYAIKYFAYDIEIDSTMQQSYNSTDEIFHQYIYLEYYRYIFRININSILASTKKKRIRTADIFAEYLVGGWKAVGSTGRRTCWTTTRGRMVEHATTRLKHRQGRGRKKERRVNDIQRNRIRTDRVVTRSNSARVSFRGTRHHFRTCNFESFWIDRGTIDKDWRIEIAFNQKFRQERRFEHVIGHKIGI